MKAWRLVTATLVVLSCVGACAGSRENVFNKVAEMIATDPYATHDPFGELTHMEQHALWESGAIQGNNISMIRESLSRFEDTVFVDVYLVGYESDGVGAVDMDAAMLASLLDSLAARTPVSVLTDADTARASPHIWAHTVFRVHRVPRALAAHLNSDIGAWRESRGKGLGGIPYSLVTDALRKHYRGTPGGYAVYLLNLVESAGQVYKPDHVLYGDASDEVCGGVTWADPDDRLMWVDVGAGPVEYGPLSGGAGVVLWNSLPRPDRFFSTATMAAEMAALVWRTAGHLLTPPMLRANVPDLPRIVVRVIVVHADEGARGDAEARSTMDGPLEAIGQELSRLALVGQRIDMDHVDVDLDSCAVCAFAFAQAQRWHVEPDETAVAAARGQRWPYLDGRVLHHWLSEGLYGGDATLLRLLGLMDPDPSQTPLDPLTMLVPVFVYDVGAMSDLLDLDHAALSFSDMVVAVNSDTAFWTPYGCRLHGDTDGPHVAMDTADVGRALLASLLESVWGLAPTHLRVSVSARGGDVVVVEDHLWSLINTPFSPLNRASLAAHGMPGAAAVSSFAQRDVVRRHAVYRHLNASTHELGSLFAHYTAYGHSLEETFGRSEAETFAMRWHVIEYKRQRVGQLLSTCDFDRALYYARSIAHDVHAMHHIVHAAGRRTHTHIECAHHPKGEWASVLVWGVTLLIWVAAVVVHRARARRESEAADRFARHFVRHVLRHGVVPPSGSPASPASPAQGGVLQRGW